MNALIHPVILSGGAGTRLWPVSRMAAPKQFEPLMGDKSMIQDTALRFHDSAVFAPPMIVCNHAHIELAQSHLAAIDMPAALTVMEPKGRNTAPAIAAAAIALQDRAGGDALMLVAPADHYIGRPDEFVAAVNGAAAAARNGHLVTFGIVPNAPKTGYGYIEAGTPLADLTNNANVRHIKAFVEKPDLQRALTYLEGGAHWWNSGIFLFSAAGLITAMQQHAPQIVAQAQQAVRNGTWGADNVLLLDEEAFSKADAISIDYAVMEHTDKGAVVPLNDIGWSDVGAWSEIWEQGTKDGNGNAVLAGDVLLTDANNNLVRGADRLIGIVGVDDLVVIDTDDALLIAGRKQAQDVKKIAEQLLELNRPEALRHPKKD